MKKCSVYIIVLLFIASLSCANKDDYFSILNERVTISSSTPGSLNFYDTDPDQDQIAGTLVISRAADESRITGYTLYWGSSPAEKLTGQSSIASFTADGNNHNYSFLPDTAVPSGATHFLVFSSGSEGETAVPLAIDIADLVIQRVSDINPGAGDSNPAFLTRFSLDGKLYFSATDGGTIYGNELWAYDGSTISLASNIKSGGSSSYPSFTVEYNGKLYFSANSTLTKIELMSFDGTTTVNESDICPKGSSMPSDLIVYNGKLYFASSDGGTTVGRELWVLDSASPPPALVSDINVGTGDSNPTGMAVYSINNKLYFNADNGSGPGKEFWEYDGTATALYDLKTSGGSDPQHLHEYKGKLYFSAIGDSGGRELWAFDGSTASLFKDINPVGDSNPTKLYNYNGRLYFAANDGTNGNELWVSDGTSSGTQLLIDINPAGDSSPGPFVTYNNRLFFPANDGTHGIELWTSDGTAAGTYMVADAVSGGDFAPTSFFVYNGRLYFSATEAANGRELYVLYYK